MKLPTTTPKEPTSSGPGLVDRFVLGPRAAWGGCIGVLVLLAGFMVLSGWNVHEQANSIVDQHRFRYLVEQLRVAVYDEQLEGRDATEVTLRPRRTPTVSHGGIDDAIADLRELSPVEVDDESVELLAAHHDADDALDRFRAAQAEGRTDLEEERLVYRRAMNRMSILVDRLVKRSRDELDLAVVRLGSTDGRMRVWAPVVFVTCAASLAGFGLVLRRYRRTIDHQSLHDTLTGLPNRNLLTERTEQALAIARRSGVDTALLLIDLDRFKEINDTLGHRYGDLVLAEIGPRLRERLRDSDTVARLGGDEFGVLLTNISGPDAAVRIADDLAEALRDTMSIGDLTFELEASIGVAVAPYHAATSVELVQKADVAMYLAKASHSSVALYRPEADEHSPERLALLGELRTAIDAGQLALYLQPKVGVAGGVLQGVEALIRWRHPVHGLIPPDRFIPLAEQTSLIEPLTAWVIGEAARTAHRWERAGLHLPIAVNVSARSLGDLGFPAQVARIVDTIGADRSSIEIEVTETSIMREPERARSVMRSLSELGFGIAVDDFGSGYTSLSSLRTMPVDELKIDRMFVAGMRSQPNDAVIVQTVIDLGRNLGLLVVAEGVEDDETRAALEAMGCPVAQGYFWSRPLPIDDFDRWRAERDEAVSSPG